MASFDRTIPSPGGQGKITLKVHTDGYEEPIHKSALVNSNDSENGAIHLGITAFGGTLAVLPAAVAPIIQMPTMRPYLSLSETIRRFFHPEDVQAHEIS